MRILFFIECLKAGGKERRLVDLINGLSKSTNFNCKLVLLINSLHYADKLPENCELIIFDRKWVKKDPLVFLKVYKVCHIFKPDLIHVWGNMPAFYALPSSIFLKIPIINSQITDSFGISFKQPFSYLLHKLNFYFASIIISNSVAGLISYKAPNKKSKVIYNGVSLKRFRIDADIQHVRNEFNIKTKYSVVMVGSFSKYKNFDLFIDAAKYYQKVRNDLTFVAVGSGENLERIQKRLSDEEIKNIILTGSIKNVEELISICDIGILLSPFGEGISNALIEYMALSKPVIASNKGGNCELIDIDKNGILLKDDNLSEVCKAIDVLLSDDYLRDSIGENNRKKIEEQFTADRMTSEFMNVYIEVLSNENTSN